MTVLRFLRFRDFAERVQALKPDTIFYNAEAAPTRRPPVAMRLFFYHEGDVYVFLDFVSTGQGRLRETRLRIYDHKKRTAYLKDEDIEQFLVRHFKGVKTRSLGVIGGPTVL